MNQWICNESGESWYEAWWIPLSHWDPMDCVAYQLTSCLAVDLGNWWAPPKLIVTQKTPRAAETEASVMGVAVSGEKQPDVKHKNMAGCLMSWWCWWLWCFTLCFWCREKCAKQHHMYQSKNVYAVLVFVSLGMVFLYTFRCWFKKFYVYTLKYRLSYTFAFLAEQFHLLLWVR